MNFDDIQKSWKDQPVREPVNVAQLKSDVKTRWEKQQRRLKLTNIGVTLAFAGTIAIMASVYVSFHEGHTIFFGGSIFAMWALMVVYLGVMWRGLAYKKDAMEVSSTEYLDYQIKKLAWQRKVIAKYSQVYAVILWLCLMLYMWDVTTGGSLWYKIGAPLITSAYIFGMLVYVNMTKRRKQIKKIDELVADLEELKGSFANNEIEE